ncbi:MAG: hypothetical protein AB2L12_12185 [Smithellaceae bacterium]
MDPKQITRQLIDFNKMVFDNIFNAMTILHDRTENTVFRFLEKAQWIPDDGNKAFQEWANAYKKNREYFKAYTDESYEKVTDYFTKAEKEETQKNVKK